MPIAVKTHAHHNQRQCPTVTKHKGFLRFQTTSADWDPDTAICRSLEVVLAFSQYCSVIQDFQLKEKLAVFFNQLLIMTFKPLSTNNSLQLHVNAVRCYLTYCSHTRHQSVQIFVSLYKSVSVKIIWSSLHLSCTFILCSFSYPLNFVFI